MLKEKVNKHDGFIIENTKDINIMVKDMNVVKDEIEKIKMSLEKLGKGNSDGKNGNNIMDIESIRNINNEAHKMKNDIDKIHGDMSDMKNNLAELLKELE